MKITSFTVLPDTPPRLKGLNELAHNLMDNHDASPEYAAWWAKDVIGRYRESGVPKSVMGGMSVIPVKPPSAGVFPKM